MVVNVLPYVEVLDFGAKTEVHHSKEVLATWVFGGTCRRPEVAQVARIRSRAVR